MSKTKSDYKFTSGLSNACIRFSDYQQYGCPACGYNGVFQSFSNGAEAVVNCAKPECGQGYTIVGDDAKQTHIKIGGKHLIPMEHPRKGR